ncbi:hypothetical protein HN681_00125 [archaeon]|jgi:hypothetical protein|nr:hypothetical protein [archaeon]MBT3730368.1 hypothetical protein [archaeon]MBT4669924.1 hypothetical protein [archaeon]MBT7052667.1 hypothetical protein [archaeon]MBT7280863.1 hypothetical protein [archaeon]
MVIDQKVLNELIEARSCADEGNVGLMSYSLIRASQYAKDVGQNVSEQRKEIENLGYKNGIPVALAEAREDAEEGDAEEMEVYLSSASRYAEEIGVDISEQINEIENLGYKNAIPLNLAEARSCAEDGEISNMQIILGMANDYAHKIGQDISTEVTGIEALVL